MTHDVVVADTGNAGLGGPECGCRHRVGGRTRAAARLRRSPCCTWRFDRKVGDHAMMIEARSRLAEVLNLHVPLRGAKPRISGLTMLMD